MKRTLANLSRTVGVLFSSTLAIAAFDATAQQPNKLDADSTPAYQERNVTPPASATAARDKALNTVPGKVSSGKQPSTGRANGLGMDAGADSMSKKP